MLDDTTKTEFFECGCRYPDHLLIVRFEPEYNELSLEIHLSHYLPWWKRLLAAVKYVFKYRSQSSHFDNFLFKPKDVQRIKEICELPK